MKILLTYCLLCFILSHGHSKTAKKEKLPATIQNFNFTKRPLNLYIPANGVHVKVEEKEGNGAKYFFAEPPFLIKRRGNILLLHDLMDNSFFTGRPSIIQQIAASGHCCYFVTYSDYSKISPSFNKTNAVLLLQSPHPTHKSVVENVVDETRPDGIMAVRPEFPVNLDIPTVILDEKNTGYINENPKYQEIVKPSLNNTVIMQVLANFLDFVHPR
ncbi:unnamed protein product [Bursaphelenchus xylophilus]|uniref:(pine wood nematode) hypothetical protein n=1 Tax=Bursaphelenchus xylophilus TaxID=6326 RepID=A0A1I7S014_BURXY|nr:unnamed protein product [Bursaphelenchus xylophilus]CAG9109088.1 unnamed protein product [Bursaphelenchus xylophilus]